MIHLNSETGELFTHSYQFAQRQVRTLIEKHPMLYPLHTKDGLWKSEGELWTHWSDGFLPGMMWIFYRHAEQGSTDAKFWYENAVRYTEPIEPRKKDRDAHLYPGEGTIDWDEAMALLRSAPHVPPLLFEIEGEGQEQAPIPGKMAEAFKRLGGGGAGNSGLVFRKGAASAAPHQAKQGNGFSR